jgi:hypothetical protein
VPPLLSKEPTSQVQPSSESLQETASRGDLSTKSSTIEQWQRASVPLNDATSSSGYDEIVMATIDQKLTPMNQKATPSSEVVNQMAKESGEQRVEVLHHHSQELPQHIMPLLMISFLSSQLLTKELENQQKCKHLLQHI